MSAIWLCASKEWLLRLADRWSVVVWLAVPLAIGGMMTSLTGGGDGPQPSAKVLLVDQDQSFISGLLGNAFAQPDADGFINLESVELDDGQARIEAGDASALLIIPPGFGDAVLKEQPAVIEMRTNPAQRILPGIVEEFMGVMVDGVFYLHRVFGDELRMITANVDASDPLSNEIFSDTQIAQLSISVNQAMESLVGYLDPVIIELQDAAGEQSEDNAPAPGFALLFFPGVLFMALLFAAQGLSDSFWRERDDGTLRRTVMSPLTLGQMMLGKILAAAGFLGLVMGILLSIGFVYHDLSFALWLPALVFCVLSGLLLFGLMALIQLISPTRKSASLITTILVFPMMMAGGSFFPTEAMPDWMGVASQWLPNGFLLERLKDALIYEGSIAPLWVGLAYLLPVAFLFWALSGWRLRRFAVAAA